jgi:hypothetical protein
MMERIAEVSPRPRARITGVVYLLYFLTAVSAEVFVGRGRLVLYDAVDLIGFALYIAVTLLFYYMFRPVNRSLSLLAAFFSLVGCAIGAFNCLFHLAPLVVLGGAPSLSAFNVEQLQALALMFLKLHAQGYNIAMVLFGSYNLLIGYLIFRSTFMPRILGVLLAFSGLCYETNCFANFLSPGFAAHLVPYILAPGVAELLLALWLVVMGVNVQRWNEQAGAAGVRA